ncbi:multifunctional CCA tRNA nucleotidyl transferase/2'3'-cyclic phosphodiesterase/2'nucleotidase/phosphatase [Marinobacter daepoensis]|uniref:CCA-adding enzyme n=1 Tax=Marinobacter daepoensis TaxID=262077 RepID=A0ABS3BJ73_9GAMM|nr:multifunctional CCA tRNA nucleotidyl transferase/2'3'-cyclic phosphodiesterase/2'nucleotidase/phosphatase [Marinobacter daepoensis]MBN7770787.1 multifunctional CCA tRNA nucleotidyl transferase/2'3'-cyclic phosphodiesterase/2'nucleotidase/phosphatase [Marinobacter daepoensis]MBY6078648.1 multifunctional CCA tRNA nucleotidyl transferase/2'3'-cyclic phosphodiesterase/2'nucleotidase/phosphatase [Marinobacter daepoensis]
MQIYLVGGAVRDKLLGLNVKDRDWVVVGATPDTMQQKGFKQVGADFPVFLHPATGEEYALARTERKQGRGYHGFDVYSAPDVTLEEDLKRRDLTINAIAEADDGQLVDPFNGRADLDQRVLRHVSDAFSEDPLRILRTARFAARLTPLGFRISEETMNLMQAMVARGELRDLTPERVWQEVQRALHEHAPAVFFKVLKALGALKVLIPELNDETNFQNGMQALECIHLKHGSTAQRFAALLSEVPGPAAVNRAKAMKSPVECREMAHLVCLFTAKLRSLASARDITPEETLALLDQADLWRRPERFETLLDTLPCTLDHGNSERNGESDTSHFLEKAARHAKNVTPQPFLQRGIQGKALGEAIRNERLRRITEVMS